MESDSGQQMKKYISATKEKISIGRNVDAESSVAFRVISPTANTEASEERLMRSTRLLTSGGSTLRTACGSTILTNVVRGDSPSTFAASVCPTGTVCMPAR